jgi:uncharacterized membrane protein (DUF373 family)
MDELKVYLAICFFALIVSTAVRMLYKLTDKNLSHEKEHDLGNFIKFFILIILALLMLYLTYSRLSVSSLSV